MSPSRLSCAVLLLALTLASGCATKDANLIGANYFVANELMGASALAIDKDRPILVAPFMDVDRLDRSSSFGRLTAEQLSSRFAQAGYVVLEAKLRRENLYARQGSGETLLSAELKNLCETLNAQAVLIGTYSAAAEKVYVTARLVRPTDNVILASHDYWLPLGPDTNTLLQPSRYRVAGSF